MTIPEVRSYYDGVKEAFANPNEISNAINLLTCGPLKLSDITKSPELNRFFGGEENSFGEFLEKGLSSLRQECFYKLSGNIQYRKDIFPNTFAAEVYCWHPNDNKMLKYIANIGPMLNSHSGYLPLLGTLETSKVSLWTEFKRERENETPPVDYYYQPKYNFFSKLLISKQLFFVVSSEFDPDYPDAFPKPKKVAWSFIEY